MQLSIPFVIIKAALTSNQGGLNMPNEAVTEIQTFTRCPNLNTVKCSYSKKSETEFDEKLNEVQDEYQGRSKPKQ